MRPSESVAESEGSVGSAFRWVADAIAESESGVVFDFVWAPVAIASAISVADSNFTLGFESGANSSVVFEPAPESEFTANSFAGFDFEPDFAAKSSAVFDFNAVSELALDSDVVADFRLAVVFEFSTKSAPVSDFNANSALVFESVPDFKRVFNLAFVPDVRPVTARSSNFAPVFPTAMDFDFRVVSSPSAPVERTASRPVPVT